MRRIVFGLFVLLLAVAVTVPAAATNDKPRSKGSKYREYKKSPFHHFFQLEHANIATQDGKGVASKRGAAMLRTHHAMWINLEMATPEPKSYKYPDNVEGTPPIKPGWPEVFTGWAFVFNFPHLCTPDPATASSEPVCDFDDLGDTAAQGGVYNFDGQVIWQEILVLKGHIEKGQLSGNPPGKPGVRLQNPTGAEVHAAIAPHGMALEDYIETQTSAPAGSPACACWWVAVLHGGGNGFH